MHLHIACPLGKDQELRPHTERSISELAKSGICEKITWAEYKGLYIGENRNNGITESSKIWQKEFKADAFLFVDWDMDFTISDVDDLIQSGKSVVSAAYPFRKTPEKYVAGTWRDDTCIESQWLLSETKGMQKVGFVGAGLLLVRSEAFAEIPYPYFRHVIIENGDEAKEYKEDIGFCLNLKRHGIDVFCNCEVVAGHYLNHC